MRWPLQTELGLIRQALRILEPRERRQLLLLVPATLTVAVLELTALAPLGPFISLLADPERFNQSRLLQWVFVTFGFSSTESLFLFMGLSILALLVTSNAAGAANTWAMLRFAWMRDASLSTRLLRSYLYRPYPFFLEQNTADLLRKSLMEVRHVSIDVMWHLMALISRSFIIVLIAGALFYVEPMMACGAVFVFGGVYGTLFSFSRRWAGRTGREHTAANIQRFKIATDALQGAKEIKLYRLEEPVLRHFEAASIQSSASASSQNLLAQLPRYALETVAFGAMLVMMLYLLKTRHTLHGSLPILGLYIFASMRLLPALQAVFGAFNTIRYHATVVGQIAKEFEGDPPRLDEEIPQQDLPFDRSLKFEEVGFSYAGAQRPLLERLSLSIRRGEWVALVGPTGSGKSTLVDLMLGLLEPTSGTIAIDGASLSRENHRGWQAQTGYVPQQIFLVNDSVEANICFGIPSERVDRAMMERAARIAQIHEFVTKELSNGYQSVVGDRGIRLSGGQRQRIGIARALYRSPKFLVLDEATSALDGATETAFFEALRTELRACTVVSVTHRVTTTRNFDRVYRLEAGVIVGEMDRDMAAQESTSPLAHSSAPEDART